jgi:hypothetical protein
MHEIHAKPIVDGQFWVVEQDGIKIATLRKEINNHFRLSNADNIITFEKEDELIDTFGSSFFLTDERINVPVPVNDCHGFPTKSTPYNAMYDIRRKLPLYTKQPHSKCYICAGWYRVKFKAWVSLFCPKIITLERYEYYGPFKTKQEVKCNHQ